MRSAGGTAQIVMELGLGRAGGSDGRCPCQPKGGPAPPGIGVPFLRRPARRAGGVGPRSWTMRPRRGCPSRKKKKSFVDGLRLGGRPRRGIIRAWRHGQERRISVTVGMPGARHCFRGCFPVRGPTARRPCIPTAVSAGRGHGAEQLVALWPFTAGAVSTYSVAQQVLVEDALFPGGDRERRDGTVFSGEAAPAGQSETDGGALATRGMRRRIGRGIRAASPPPFFDGRCSRRRRHWFTVRGTESP